MVRAWVGSFDFRYANYAVGSPEWLLLDMVSRKIFQYLTGSMPRDGALLSLARQTAISPKSLGLSGSTSAGLGNY